MLLSHDHHQRGRRVREFVCSHRPLRDEEGRTVQLPSVALDHPRVAASTLAPLLAGESVEVFAVACLSTRHRLLAWHVLSRGTRQSTPVSLPDVFVPACLTPGTTALLVVHTRYAKATFRKDRWLNICLSSEDLEAIQKRELAEGCRTRL